MNLSEQKKRLEDEITANGEEIAKKKAEIGTLKINQIILFSKLKKVEKLIDQANDILK